MKKFTLIILAFSLIALAGKLGGLFLHAILDEGTFRLDLLLGAVVFMWLFDLFLSHAFLEGSLMDVITCRLIGHIEIEVKFDKYECERCGRKLVAVRKF